MKLPRITVAAWRKAAIGSALIVATFIVFNTVDGYRQFKLELNGMGGVSLNQSRAEVMYRLGAPPIVLGPWEASDPFGSFRSVLSVGGPEGDQNTMPRSHSPNDYQAWVYSSDGRVDVTVEFDKAGRVQSISCTDHGESLLACSPLAGMRSTDPEEKVLRLGTPSTNSVDGVTKTIEYADIGASYYLTKGRAYSLTLKRPTGGRWAVLRRYIQRVIGDTHSFADK